MPEPRQSRTRIKICGLTRPEDAAVASDCGVDAVGLVFYAGSPRAVSPAQAAEICAALGPLVSPVALFVDPAPAEVEAILARVPVAVLQFHGAESPADCSRYGRPWLKALRMHPGIDLAAEAGRYAGASGLLLDSFRAGVPGGTGETFDWARVPPGLVERLVLAGGLKPGNVAAAIAQLRPAAVDVSGGVEDAPGRKSAGRIADFVAAVRQADAAGLPGAVQSPFGPARSSPATAAAVSPSPTHSRGAQ